jgi:dihydrofolate reductase
MPLSLIVAMTRSGVIGRRGGLPWRLSADLRRFKALTMGHHVLMGRKTYDSLGRPLPGRTLVVITRQTDLALPPGVRVVHGLDVGLQHAAQDQQPFVIGGSEIFALALPFASRLCVTWVESEVEGDTYFPAWNPAAWQLTWSERHAADAKNEYETMYCVYERST